MSLEVINLGCRLNLSESEEMRTLLASAENLIVINSCAVTAEAVRQTRQSIRRARAARPDARLMVTGCAAEIEREMLSNMPEVDGLIANSVKLDPRAWNVGEAGMKAETQHTRAFVQVQNGCDHSCTFCVIPQGRGPSRSLTIPEVLNVISEHSNNGIQEIVLTGVDLTSWGTDLPNSPKLGKLASEILRTYPALSRLRLSSLDGPEIDDQLFELIAGEQRVMPHIHLSLQSGDDMILKRMKRRHTRQEADKLTNRLRDRRPEIAIGADLIAGFPTEEDAAHANNLSLISELNLVHCHIFPYSIRPGTPAARMPQVDRPTVKQRAAQLRNAAAIVRENWLADQVGKKLSVLAERDGTGHAPNFARVKLPEGVMAGSLIDITPTRLHEGLLI